MLLLVATYKKRVGIATKIQEPLNAPFLMGCFPVDFQDAKRPLRTKSVKRPIKVGKRPINEGKRPTKAKVLVGVSVGCLMGCFRAPPPWRKTAPLKRPINQGCVNGGFQTVVRVSAGEQIPAPHSYLHLASILPLFYLKFTSF